MVRPVAGVITNVHFLEDRFPVQLAGDGNLCALPEVADTLPLIFARAADTIDIGALLDGG
jgi:putative glutamine amidotransferase